MALWSYDLAGVVGAIIEFSHFVFVVQASDSRSSATGHETTGTVIVFVPQAAW
jgi:hypothetical protein